MVKSYPMGHPKTKKQKNCNFFWNPLNRKKDFVCNLSRQICQIAISSKLSVYDSFGSVYRFLQVRKWGYRSKNYASISFRGITSMLNNFWTNLDHSNIFLFSYTTIFIPKELEYFVKTALVYSELAKITIFGKYWEIFIENSKFGHFCQFWK